MRVLLAVVTVLALPPLAAPDSLGSAARKQAQRRDQSPRVEVKAYGDRDLSPRADPSADEPDPSPAAESDDGAPPTTPEGTTAPASASGPAEDEARQALEREERARRQKEAYWRQRAQSARTRVAQAQSNYDFVCNGGTLLTGG